MAAAGTVFHLAELTWEQARTVAATGAVVVVPTGSLEQHGPHLPLRTDTALVAAVAEAAVARLPSEVAVALAPPLWLGASHHHLPLFAISLEERTYVEVAVQVGCTLVQGGFRKLFFLNGHGGNAAPLRLAVAELGRRHPQAVPASAEYWALAAPALRGLRQAGPGGAAHACEVETALMMALAPGEVRSDRLRRAVPDTPAPWRRDLTDAGPVTVGVAWERLSPEGTSGDPTLATPEKGRDMLQACAAALAETLAAFARWEPLAAGP